MTILAQIPGADQAVQIASSHGWEAVLLTVLIFGGLTVLSACMWKLTNMLGSAAQGYIAAHVLANGKMAESIASLDKSSAESAILMAQAVEIQKEGAERDRILLVVMREGFAVDKTAHDEAVVLLRQLLSKKEQST